MTVVFLALAGEPRAEGATRVPPAALGRVLGLDRAPEVKTIRRKLAQLAAAGKAAELVMALARRNAAARPDALGFLYIDGHGRAAFGPEMMVALLLYGYGQGERSGRVTGKRWVRDVACRVIAGGLHRGHAATARFRARHETALGGLFSQVLRLLAAEGMVSPGTLSLDGAKLAGNAARKADRTLPQIGKILAGAAGLTPPATPGKAAARSRRPRGRWPAGPGGGSGWPGPGTGWRPGTRRVARRSGRSRRRGTRPQQPGSGAGAARPASRRAQPGRDRAAAGHHRPGRAGDAEPQRLRSPAATARPWSPQARSSPARCSAGTRPAAPCPARCRTPAASS